MGAKPGRPSTPAPSAATALAEGSYAAPILVTCHPSSRRVAPSSSCFRMLRGNLLILCVGRSAFKTDLAFRKGLLKGRNCVACYLRATMDCQITQLLQRAEAREPFIAYLAKMNKSQRLQLGGVYKKHSKCTV